ncbi:unnamed protein product [Ambrosiozyma monospora]|uniref:Unnamed protein product n=1 Tax=Ambrosiozyma monospora TaxID=43982 RepID=A0ACB5U3L1_AMBMO|nr:unnamed protein product [Ambrosiozyma monospora]
MDWNCYEDFEYEFRDLTFKGSSDAPLQSIPYLNQNPLVDSLKWRAITDNTMLASAAEVIITIHKSMVFDQSPTPLNNNDSTHDPCLTFSKISSHSIKIFANDLKVTHGFENWHSMKKLELHCCSISSDFSDMSFLRYLSLDHCGISPRCFNSLPDSITSLRLTWLRLIGSQHLRLPKHLQEWKFRGSTIPPIDNTNELNQLSHVVIAPDPWANSYVIPEEESVKRILLELRTPISIGFK